MIGRPDAAARDRRPDSELGAPARPLRARDGDDRSSRLRLHRPVAGRRLGPLAVPRGAGAPRRGRARSRRRDRRRGCRDRRAGLSRNRVDAPAYCDRDAARPGSRRSPCVAGLDRRTGVRRQQPVRSAEVDVSNAARPADERDDHRRPARTRRPARGVEQLPRGDAADLQLDRRRASTGRARSRSTPRRRRPERLPVGPRRGDRPRPGRQYYSYDRATPCNAQGSSHVYVLDARQARTAAWSQPVLVAPLGARASTTSRRSRSTRRRRARTGTASTSPGPVIARNTSSSIVLSHSDDGGRDLVALRSRSAGTGDHDVTYASRGRRRGTATVYVAWTDETELQRSRSPARPTAARTSGPSSSSRRSRRSRSRTAASASSSPAEPRVVHPGRSDRLRRHVRRALHRPRLRQLHGHELHRGRGRGAVDVRQPPAARSPGTR